MKPKLQSELTELFNDAKKLVLLDDETANLPHSCPYSLKELLHN